MNNLFEIKQSTIAGYGDFALERISKGRTICFLEGESYTLDEVLKRVNEGKEEPSDFLQVEDEQYLHLYEIYRIFNHSCNPNAFVRGKNELIA